MTCEGAGASGGYDTGAYPPGPARTSGTGWAGIGFAAAVFAVIAAAMAVWVISWHERRRVVLAARPHRSCLGRQGRGSTWAKWGADGNGDGVASPNQIDDAALAAARYLCASGTMTNTAGWRAAVFSYNQSNAYVNEVAAIANRYAADVKRLS